MDYINEALAGVQAAEDISNLQQRNYVTGEKRGEFKAAVLALRESFQVLKRFIKDAFPDLFSIIPHTMSHSIYSCILSNPYFPRIFPPSLST